MIRIFMSATSQKFPPEAPCTHLFLGGQFDGIYMIVDTPQNLGSCFNEMIKMTLRARQGKIDVSLGELGMLIFADKGNWTTF